MVGDSDANNVFTQDSNDIILMNNSILFSVTHIIFVTVFLYLFVGDSLAAPPSADEKCSPANTTEGYPDDNSNFSCCRTETDGDGSYVECRTCITNNGKIECNEYKRQNAVRIVDDAELTKESSDEVQNKVNIMNNASVLIKPKTNNDISNAKSDMTNNRNIIDLQKRPNANNNTLPLDSNTASPITKLKPADTSGYYAFINKWGTQGTGNGEFKQPIGIAIDSAGYVYVADSQNNRVQKFTSDGTFITSWKNVLLYTSVFGIAVDSAGYVYVSDGYNSKVQKFTSDGAFITSWGVQGTGNGYLNFPTGIAADSVGNVYVVEYYNNRVQKFTSDGAFITKWGTQGSGNGEFQHPSGIAVDPTGYVYVADTENRRIQKFTQNGAFVTKWGTQGTGNGQFKSTDFVAVDSSGDVYVTDAFNFRVQKFTNKGTYIQQWGTQGSGNGQFSYPSGIAIEPSSSRVYVGDTSNNRIQVFLWKNNITKITPYFAGK